MFPFLSLAGFPDSHSGKLRKKQRSNIVLRRLVEEWTGLPGTTLKSFDDSYQARRVIYTVGHSTRSLEGLVKLLKKHGIDLVVDVRRFPTSSKYPDFKREKLSKVLEEKGIQYVWLGELLGGYREGGYEAYMKTDGYKRGLEKLLRIIRGFKRPAIMCSEKLWFRCHRRFISDSLVKLGFEVIHIIDEEHSYRHRGRG